MNEVTIALGVMSALLNGVAYFLYGMRMKKGQTQPNAASWSIWTFLAALNAITFRQMSGDVIAALQFFVGSAACLLVFLYAMFFQKFSRPKFTEWWCLALGLVAVIVWWVFRNADAANIIVLSALVISFIPTYIGVWRNPSAESPMPWILWTIVFLTAALNVILRDIRLIALAMPVMLVAADAGVAILCSNARRARLQKNGDTFVVKNIS